MNETYCIGPSKQPAVVHVPKAPPARIVPIWRLQNIALNQGLAEPAQYPSPAPQVLRSSVTAKPFNQPAIP